MTFFDLILSLWRKHIVPWTNSCANFHLAVTKRNIWGKISRKWLHDNDWTNSNFLPSSFGRYSNEVFVFVFVFGAIVNFVALNFHFRLVIHKFVVQFNAILKIILDPVLLSFRSDFSFRFHYWNVHFADQSQTVSNRMLLFRLIPLPFSKHSLQYQIQSTVFTVTWQELWDDRKQTKFHVNSSILQNDFNHKFVHAYS